MNVAEQIPDSAVEQHDAADESSPLVLPPTTTPATESQEPEAPASKEPAKQPQSPDADSVDGGGSAVEQHP